MGAYYQQMVLSQGSSIGRGVMIASLCFNKPKHVVSRALGFSLCCRAEGNAAGRRGFKGAARQALSAVRELKAEVSVRHGGVDEWAVGVWLEFKHRVLGVTRLDGHCIDVGLRFAFGAIAERTQRR